MAKKKENLSPEELLKQALVPECEWPYMVPENWVWVYLNDGFAECLDKFRKPVNGTERDERSGGIPYYGATGQVGWIDDFLTNEHLVLVGEDGAPFLEYIKNKAYIIDGKAWVNNHAHILRSRYGKVGNEFLMHYLNIFNFHGYVSGTTRLKLTQASMNRIPIVLPPHAEQQRIVDRIESLFEKLDQAKGLIQDALDSFENRKAAILHKAFSGELTKKWREENGVGMESWEEKTLKSCGTWYGGGTPSKASSDYWENGTIPWVSPKDMKSRYIEQSEDYITEKAVKESSTNLVTENSLLFVVRSGILRRILPIAINNVVVTINQDMKALIPKGINSEFIYWQCVFEEANIREKCSKSGTTVESISTELLYNFVIKVPNIAEQKELVNVLNVIFSKEESAEELIDLHSKIDHMKKSILARAFRGDLGTNDPSEESALSLLNEVLKNG